MARRVSAASPDGKKTRWPRSAQSRHNGPASSRNIRSPLPPHDAHDQSLTGMITTKSGRRLCRATARSESSGDTQCVRYARSMASSPVTLNRSRRRSRVRAT
ncbi:Uncharacterised protein [Mycobacterium tuberculosis]|uniref:Uncharacterized protein n=1 Tax=Mycobacterium tuberculosis TaxID=1773 RepID=A0A0U0TFM4_MYCTX|nr:Uncharacterised protein [Mycobacterium tuberculosis]